MASSGQKIAIVTDDPGWHGRQLKQALRKHGLEGIYVSLTGADISIAAGHPFSHLPGFDAHPPLGVFVRGIPGGSLEQVILRLDILHILSDQGVVVYNSPRAIERTVDKAMTSYLLGSCGIPTPPTWVCESPDRARAIYRRESAAGHVLVIKPLFGSQGEGVRRLDRAPDQRLVEEYGGVFYLQRFIQQAGTEYCDMRVFVIDGQAVAGMTRSHNDWITNRAQGARCEPLALDPELTGLAEAAVQVCRIDYAGVDLMRDANGKLQVLEVNSVPAWWGLQKTVEFNLTSRLVESFINRIQVSAQHSAMYK
ncbi:MAG: RimK family alpha-L-glutamate ligase [Thiotrichales bacterium]|nr:RimK family alpha-L-glutamate ligase [Thiotrichales bacterium]